MISRKMLEKYRDFDDFYVVRQRAGHIQGRRLVKKYGRLLGVLSELLYSCDYRLDYERLSDGLRAAQESGGYRFGNGELGAVNDLITYLIIKRLERSDAEFDNCIYTLRFLDIYDFEELYCAVSGVEEKLSEDRDGVYSRCDRATKQLYRANVSAYAKRHKIDETSAAEILKNSPETEDEHTVLRTLYFPLMYGFASALSLLFFFTAGRHFLLSQILFIPFTELSKQLLDFIYGRLLEAKIIPRLAIDSVPEDAKTLVVITSLLFGGDGDAELFSRLERFYLTNGSENVRFGILGDYPDSEEPEREEDDDVKTAAVNEIKKLNEKYGEHFALFLRHRAYCATERRFMGYERKRGALCELTALIGGEETTFDTVVCDGSFLRDIKYVITLDADTELRISSVKKLVGTMLHPANRPVVCGGRVVSGYGIIQPRMDTTLKASLKTAFSLITAGVGGTDIYSCASFDIYQTLFKTGIFCGKGIFDVAAFRSVVCHAFPPEQILSHDLLEGTRLRVGYAGDIAFNDSCPNNALSYFKRLHRWSRGDVQSLPFVRKRVPDFFGASVENPISALSKYEIIDNLRRILLPIASVLTIISAARSGISRLAVIAALSYLTVPFVTSVFTAAHNIKRRFYSFVIPGIWQSFCRVLYSISALVHTAYVNADALLRSLYRMLVSRRNLLEWVTAGEGERRHTGGIAEYYLSMPLTVIVGLLLLFFAPVGEVKLAGLAFFVFPPVSFLMGRKHEKGKRLNAAEKAVLSDYVYDMWRFFADNVGEADNFLPPDNLQTSPLPATAHRTSPTNIGLYLLSVLTARDFLFITSGELLYRLRSTLETVEKLSKYRGHLYNWYDTETLEVLGKPYISTVDSGNLVCSLIALSEGICEYAAEAPELTAVAERFAAVASAMDFSLLYNRKRELFAIGYDAVLHTCGNSFYDMYMSEARTTSYYAIATGAAPGEHWGRLSRMITERDGYIGLLSWSGTAFEYFMPTLFLPIFENSLEYEALCFAARQQRESRCGRFFGKSESCYFAFDADMNYQYKAHGVQRLGLKRGLDGDCVISPYSSFLMLPVMPHAVLANLKKLAAFGMYGEYGFYEACDMTPSRVGNGYSLIHSYMSHHLGMSIVSSANACFDGVFCKRFFKNRRMACATELITERIPTDVTAHRQNRYSKPDKPKMPNSRNTVSKQVPCGTGDGGFPKTALISNGKAKITASVSGEIMLSDGGELVTSSPFGRTLGGLKLFFAADGEVRCATDGGFSYSNDSVRYELANGRLKAITALTLDGERSVFSVSFKAWGSFRSITPCLILEPVMMGGGAYYSHPSFYDLSVEAMYEDDNILLFRRRARRARERDSYLAVTLETGSGSFDFETRKDKLLPLMFSRKDVAEAVTKPLSNSLGACINPICCIKKSSDCKSGKYSCCFLIAYANDKKDALDAVRSARNRGRNIPDGLRHSLAVTALNQMAAAGISLSEMKYSELVLGAIYHRVCGECALTSPETQGALWKYGISGDLPIVTLSLCGNIADCCGISAMLSAFLRTHRYLALKGERFDLVILYGEEDSYSAPQRTRLLEMIKECRCELLMSKNGGIFPISGMNDEALFISVSVLPVRLEPSVVPENIFHECELNYHAYKKPHEPVTKITEREACDSPSGGVYGGSFTDSGFTVIKGYQKNPFSYIYTSRQFGTLVTQNSLGFTWYRNSALMRLTPWSNDTLLDNSGERLILSLGETDYDLCAVSGRASFDRGCAVYSGTVGDGLRYTVHAGVDLKYTVKLVYVEIFNGSEAELCHIPEYRITPELGFPSNLYATCARIKTKTEGDTMFMRSFFGGNMTDMTAFLTAIPESGTIPAGESRSFCYLFGIFKSKNDRMYYMIREKYRCAADIEAAFAGYADEYSKMLGGITVDCGDSDIMRMMNYYLPYQTVASRMFARTGFYQSGGAYGFRDQLQDCLAVMLYEPKIARAHIARAASRQYTEGDVQHWWHNVPPYYGIRTRCSDDYLWLPYVCAEYIDKTSRSDILDIKLPYLSSKPLGEGEGERFECATLSPYTESLYDHCVRAIEYGLRFGAHGIPLIGGGDWNDGMNGVGIKGRGESVWLAFFLRLTLKKFIPVCEIKKDIDGVMRYRELEAQLNAAVEKSCFDGEWYLRGFYDDGEKLGSHGSSEAAIDVLPQAFSAICNGETQRSLKSLENAYRYLYSEEHKIFRLFTPPFDGGGKSVGYIRGYVPGIRENGGQYTHAAVWAAWGYLAAGDTETGVRILLDINPAKRCADKACAGRYRLEPYAMAGDIYASPEHMGRGGWSQYTGAAAWYYKIMLEEVFGYHEHGDYFTLEPRLCKAIPSFTIRINKKNTHYEIRVTNPCPDKKYPFDGGVHKIEQ